MIHEVIDITTDNSQAKLYTYFLSNSPQMDSERKRPAVIICPGGGYEFTSDREAEPIAIKLNAMGIHACVLRYSTAPAVFPTSLMELASAVALVRENAEKWNVDNKKIIAAGFSAGGHLAASLGVFWNEGFLSEKLGVPADVIKPNGLLLSYPVITSGEHAHRGSFDALVGKEDLQLLEKVSLEKQVSKDTPPTFLWHTFTDEPVPVENSFLFANALLKQKISLEMHIYPRGAHGLALGTEETRGKNNDRSVQPEVASWIEMAGRWVNGL
ncbi:alpha/beta hydrolase [Bacillus sp. FJAT-27251]|uniref:alpha/beta hydrolase n=1 Tax=Bacillus sp. FJAT-27251 TaxID=1684142 RepID=UPI0006A7AA9B|nr:alpha/beta hydrolase [Bacillus sp. FJAT-27251]